VALVGAAAACPSLLAGEGTGLAMLEAYVLAGELHTAGGDFAQAFTAYEKKLRAFVSGKQKSAVWFRGLFAPKTTLGLAVRDLAVQAFAVPFVSKPLLARSFEDALTLPVYEASLTSRLDGSRFPSLASRRRIEFSRARRRGAPYTLKPLNYDPLTRR
jgi:flavin-dependent dehydrogenase